MQKKYILYSICLASVFALSEPLSAQQQTTATQQASQQQQGRTVKGTVVDETGLAIIGASVKVQGTSTGTITDLDGNFTIQVPAGGKLEVSYIGYITQTISNLNNPRIVMAEDMMKLDEVVVVGYGSQKMKNVTGAIETLTPKDIEDLSVGSLGDALRGMMNGVSVNSALTGRPGEAPSLNIRQSSVNTAATPGASQGGDANSSPLYVIDDFISTEEAFNNLDVSEVESITVLKDASAAVYGARAAYGVVLVKTKRGEVGAPKISYNGQFGFTDALATPKMLSAYDYGRLYNAARMANTSTTENINNRTDIFQADELEAMRDLNYDLLDKEWSAAFTQRHSLNINGGTEKATYFAGVSYYQQDGNLGRLDYDRWNFRAGVNANISQWLKASLQVSGDYGERNEAKNGVSGAGTDGDYESLMRHLRFVPDYIDGYPVIYTGMENVNPSSLSGTNLYHFGAVQNSSDNIEEQTNNTSINGSVEYDFGWCDFLQGLKIKASYSKTISDSKSNDLGTTMSVYGLGTRGGSGGHLYTGDGADYTTLNEVELNNGNLLRRTMSRYDSYQMNLTVSYARTFGKHNVSALFSIEKSEAETETLQGSITNPYPFTDGTSNMVSDDNIQTTVINRSESGMLSYIGRLNYSYADKYLLEFLVRSDASTKFAPENYWGTFPSVSAGWVMSEEPWFDQEKLGIDFLKIRASFGLLGRDNIQPFIWRETYGAHTNDGGPIFGTSSSTTAGTTVNGGQTGVNRDVHWDKNYKSNLGIDLRMLDSRLSVTLNGYLDLGRDLFGVYSGTSYYPGTVGVRPAPENFASIDTYGVELSLGWRDKIGEDFNYWVKMNTGWSDNKLREYSWPADLLWDSPRPDERNDRGRWGYDCMGMFRSYQEIYEYFQKYNITTYLGRTIDDVHPGMLIYRDVSGEWTDGKRTAPDGRIDDNDMVELSHRSDNPYGMTFNFGASWKDLSFSAQLSASWGGYTTVSSTIYQESFDDMEYSNLSAIWKDMFVYNDVLDANGNIVAAENRDAKYPNLRYSDVNGQASTFWRMNAASVTLNNLTVAYSLPKKWLEPVGIASCRLNLTCQNVFSFYNPYEDHVWNNWAGTYGRYPRLRKFTLGVNVSF